MVIVDYELILGDAFHYLDRIAGADAIITDPPYGIGWNGHGGSTREWQPLVNDDGSLDLRPILALPQLVIAFGANKYPEQLPVGGRWICWDKRVVEKADRMLGSPFELAWSNKRSGFDRMYRLLHGGVVNADGANAKRVHATQKPIQLMKRIILDYTKPGDLVCDPFMGSGTTGIACLQTGRRFLGIEIDPGIFQIAQRRMEEAAAQPLLLEV